MKKVKCLLSIALGIVVGVIASCSRSDKPAPAAPEAAKQSPDNASAPPAKPVPDNATQMPKEGDNMPVREPMLE